MMHGNNFYELMGCATEGVMQLMHLCQEETKELKQGLLQLWLEVNKIR